jgi:hypothetical protein
VRSIACQVGVRFHLGRADAQGKAAMEGNRGEEGNVCKASSCG